MRSLLGLIVVPVVAGAFVTFAVAASQAQLNGFLVEVAPAEKTEVVKKGEAKQDPDKRPVIQPKVLAKDPEVKKEAVKRAVRVQVIGNAIGRVAVAPGEPNPQVLQQYRPMLWAEYYLARSVCDLTPEQRKAIARDAEHAFQEAVAKAGAGARRGIVINRRGAGMEPITRNEPDDSIREGLMKAVKDHLNPEQASKYQAELDKRAAHRRRISVDNIVAKIDESLILTTEQRDKIRETLAANWKEGWCPSPESLLFNSNMLPLIPDQFIVQSLNETQKSIWRGLHKYAGANFRFFGFMANNMANGDSPEGEALREAREAETKARDAIRAAREAAEKGGIKKAGGVPGPNANLRHSP